MAPYLNKSQDLNLSEKDLPLSVLTVVVRTTVHNTIWLITFRFGRKPSREKIDVIAVNSIKHGRVVCLKKYGCD